MSRRDVDERARELSLLLDRWDFLGVYDSSEVGPGPGEYDDLVEPIMRWLREGADAAELSRRLHETLTSDYELSPGPTSLEADLTASLVEWWASD
jgi:hypothetical protein